jgi:hypothetical protein
MSAPRFRSTVQRNAAGRYVLSMVAENGHGGATERGTQAEAMAAIPELYAELTERRPPQRGPAADGIWQGAVA